MADGDTEGVAGPQSENALRSTDPFARLDARLGKIEEYCAARNEPPPKRPWREVFSWLIPVVVTVLMFFLGYFLKDSVDLVLKERTLALNSGRAVQGVVQKLATPGLTPGERTAIAIGLAEFGDFATGPLVRQLRNRGDDNAKAAMEGLRTVALSQLAATCSGLAGVLEDQRRAYYPIWSHQRAAQLLGELRCTDALTALRAYKTILPPPTGSGTWNAFRREIQIRRDDTLRTSEVDAVAKAVSDSIAGLEALNQ